MTDDLLLYQREREALIRRIKAKDGKIGIRDLRARLRVITIKILRIEISQ